MSENYNYFKKVVFVVVRSDLTASPHRYNYKKFVISCCAILYATIFTTIAFFTFGTSINIPGSYNIEDNLVINEGIWLTMKKLCNYLLFFIILLDIILRWISCDINQKTKSNRIKQNIIFPFRPISICSIIALIPSISLFLKQTYNIDFNISSQYFNNQTFSYLLFLRIFNFASLIPGIIIFKKAFQQEKTALILAFVVIIFLIFSFSFIIYQFETSKEAIKLSNGKENLKIKSFLDAIYFSTMTVTTIGYGDITPITSAGKILIIIMSIIGIAVIATPSGILAAGFLKQLKTRKQQKKKNKSNKEQDMKKNNYKKTKK